MANLSPQAVILVISMLPLSELRGAIPLGLAAYSLSPWSVYFWAVLGNVIPVIFLLLILAPLSEYLSRRFRFFAGLFKWLFQKTRKRHSRKFELWGALALVFFVAVPLPMTGGWTGAVAAYVFGVPFRKALPLIFLGIAIAGIIVSLISLGILTA